MESPLTVKINPGSIITRVQILGSKIDITSTTSATATAAMTTTTTTTTTTTGIHDMAFSH